MNGYTLANQFRKLRHSFLFSCTEADVFYELVALCNERSWPTEFQYSNPLLCATLGISEKSLINARNRLKQAGLLEFTSGHKRSPTVYRFLDPDAEIPLPQVSQSGSQSGSQGGTQRGSQSGTSYKEQTKRKKKTPADAAAAGASSSDELKENPEPWQAWLNANTPEVQRLKTPLTAEQWQSLVTDFGEPLVKDVLLNMQNHAGLARKYTSANLTARDWCKRRKPVTLPKPYEGPPSARLKPTDLFRAKSKLPESDHEPARPETAPGCAVAA